MVSCRVPFIDLCYCAHEFSRRELRKHERLEYLEAVRCLASKPDVTGGLENATNLYQSFQATHSQQTPDIHWVVSHRRSLGLSGVC